MSEKQKQELLDRMSKIGSPEQRLIFSYMQHSTEQNTEIIHPSKITNAVLLIALHGNVEHKTQLPAAQATQAAQAAAHQATKKTRMYMHMASIGSCANVVKPFVDVLIPIIHSFIEQISNGQDVKLYFCTLAVIFGVYAARFKLLEDDERAFLISDMNGNGNGKDDLEYIYSLDRGTQKDNDFNIVLHYMYQDRHYRTPVNFFLEGTEGSTPIHMDMLMNILDPIQNLYVIDLACKTITDDNTRSFRHIRFNESRDHDIHCPDNYIVISKKNVNRFTQQQQQRAAQDSARPQSARPESGGPIRPESGGPIRPESARPNGRHHPYRQQQPTRPAWTGGIGGAKLTNTLLKLSRYIKERQVAFHPTLRIRKAALEEINGNIVEYALNKVVRGKLSSTSTIQNKMRKLLVENVMESIQKKYEKFKMKTEKMEEILNKEEKYLHKRIASYVKENKIELGKDKNQTMVLLTVMVGKLVDIACKRAGSDLKKQSTNKKNRVMTIESSNVENIKSELFKK